MARLVPLNSAGIGSARAIVWLMDLSGFCLESLGVWPILPM